MEQVTPWSALLALIEPAYPKAGRCRRPYPLETMLRIHLMQHWFGFSDPGMEEALYEIAPLRQFARLSLTRALPDETTILNFRRLLETHGLAVELFKRINEHLVGHGMLLRQGTMEIGRAHAELQSLMRISYAVFCLKKKKQIRTKINNQNMNIIDRTYQQMTTKKQD